jgi:hypothetical protein
MRIDEPTTGEGRGGCGSTSSRFNYSAFGNLIGQSFRTYSEEIVPPLALFHRGNFRLCAQVALYCPGKKEGPYAIMRSTMKTMTPILWLLRLIRPGSPERVYDIHVHRMRANFLLEPALVNKALHSHSFRLEPFGTEFGSYPVFPGGNPNDFFCEYSISFTAGGAGAKQFRSAHEVRC